ncbi:hypothetical protein [Paenibacillus caui]|uniref:hypothetical protein n=1 Tax=Paenibacillus caui TaxID=2873927 RepID=UPI001CA8D6AB|nr:hypothetical protein [Paenibacillus caui]
MQIRSNYEKIALLSILSILLLIPNATFAQNNAPLKNDKKVVRAFVSTDGFLKEISLEEYVKMKEDAENLETEKAKNLAKEAIKSLYSPLAFGDQVLYRSYVYNESGYIYATPRPTLNKRISVAVRNPNNSAVDRTINYTASQSFSANIGVTASSDIGKAISLGITGGASWSETYSSSDSVVHHIPPLTYAWMDYYPIMNNTYGYTQETIHYYNLYTGFQHSEPGSNIWTDIFVAREMAGGLPDGVYTVVESGSLPDY